MKLIKDIISQLQFEFTTISKLKVHHKCNDLFDQVHSKKNGDFILQLSTFQVSPSTQSTEHLISPSTTHRHMKE